MPLPIKGFSAAADFHRRVIQMLLVEWSFPQSFGNFGFEVGHAFISPANLNQHA